MVGRRRALLISVEEYGDGFVRLPAVRNDVEVISGALERCGYDIIVASEDEIQNASVLNKCMLDFCRECGSDDVRLIYFTGHGMLVKDDDCILPSGVSRADAIESKSQRVSTDLSQTVEASDCGLVILVIDACRDKTDAPITKGSTEWGDPKRLSIPEEHRFIRFFGCRANEVCQILPDGHDGKPVSVFSKALADVLSKEESASLELVLKDVQKRCLEIVKGKVLARQKPRLSYGETSADTSGFLQQPIFESSTRPTAIQLWKSFDTKRFHCLIVSSEKERRDATYWGVDDLARDALAADTGERIWTAFRACCDGQKLVSGAQRELKADFDPSAIALGTLCVTDAFNRAESLDEAVRGLIEADLVVFDVTGFEPGVMFLIGVRSACRRGVSVCSIGGGWREGQPLDNLPFNLQDLNINSHTPREAGVGPNPVVERFVMRIKAGFEQLAQQPRYLDLPAYDALRQLGSQYVAASTINLQDSLLVLCSYKEPNFANWEYVSSSLKQALGKKKVHPKIQRLIDFGTPQLVSQYLYERIRRTAACIVDWSDYSESVFLEFGARLAVSPWGSVQIVDKRYLSGGEEARDLDQIESMRRLFKPIEYQRGGFGAFEKAASALLERNPHLDSKPEYSRVNRVVLETIGSVEQCNPEVYEELKESADALHSPEQGREAAPQVLFHGNHGTKQDCERAALERRIAAWLYLDRRVKAGALEDEQQLKKQYRDLARSAADALYDLGGDEDIKLAMYIEEQVDR